MDVLLKVTAICIPAAIFTAAIKKDSPAMALALAMAAGAGALYLAAGAISEITEFVNDLAESAGISTPVLTIVIKTVGIAIVSKLTADVCREAGLLGAASATELAGTAASLYVALPLMKTTFQMISDLL